MWAPVDGRACIRQQTNLNIAALRHTMFILLFDSHITAAKNMLPSWILVTISSEFGCKRIPFTDAASESYTSFAIITFHPKKDQSRKVNYDSVVSSIIPKNGKKHQLDVVIMCQSPALLFCNWQKHFLSTHFALLLSQISFTLMNCTNRGLHDVIAHLTWTE